MRIPVFLCLVSLLGLAGCPKSAPEPSMEAYHDALRAPPRLPSPHAGSYARVATQPSDPVIAALVEDLRWDASLGGGAAGLALRAANQQGGLYGWEVREAAWAAGYPYPVREVRGWSTPQANPPPPELVAWLQTLDDSVDLGLVRARGARGDAWVALTAAPRIDLGLQPRAARRGDEITLPTLPGARFTALDPAGELMEGALDSGHTLTLDLVGEWLIQVTDAQGVAAKFPVYVDLVPPTEPLLTELEPVASDEALLNQVSEVFQELREIYERDPWRRDLILTAAARASLNGEPAPLDELAQRLGVRPDQTWRLECRAATVEDCLDRILWDPYQRAAILSDASLWGLAVKRAQPGVHLVALVAAEES